MPIPSNPIYERLVALAACLCSEIQNPENGVPDVCFCGIIPGDQAVAEYSGDCSTACGMAWVRMVSLYASNSVGAMDLSPGNCEKAMGMDAEIGMLRCITVGDEQGNLPSAAEMSAATELQIADALLMFRAVYCCDLIPAMDVVLGQYTPLGPEGGLVGGVYTLSMAV